MTKRKRYLYYSILMIFNLFLMELCAYGVGDFLAKSHRVFYQEESDLHDYADYLRYRDPVLGWTSTLPDKKDRDKMGSRPIPAYPDPDRFPSCISLYGDSFTYAEEVDDDHAWSNLLSKLEQCRVANYAVGGYGTDQAYLRFKLNQNDESPIVILGIFSDNIIRNVNQLRNLYYPMRYGLTPKFILNRTGDLELVPLPEMSKADYEKLVKDPNSFLPYEYFRLDGPQGPFKLRFPFTISLIKSWRHFRVIPRIMGRPYWADFYQENHPSGSLVITAKIAKAFWDLAICRNKQPVIILIPHPVDLQYFLKTGVWSFQNLVDRLAKEGVECLNLGPGMVDYLQGRNPFKLIKVKHYNEEGNQVIAGLVDNYLKVKKDEGPRVSARDTVPVVP
ncbi:MAG: hypothetical protein WBV23_07590 [Desulfobaccales bacterium]